MARHLRRPFTGEGSRVALALAKAMVARLGLIGTVTPPVAA